MQSKHKALQLTFITVVSSTSEVQCDESFFRWEEAAACVVAAAVASLFWCGFFEFAESADSIQQQLRGSSAAYDSDICHRYLHSNASCTLSCCHLLGREVRSLPALLIVSHTAMPADNLPHFTYRSLRLDTRSSQQHTASGFCLSPAIQGEPCMVYTSYCSSCLSSSVVVQHCSVLLARRRHLCCHVQAAPVLWPSNAHARW